MDDSFNCEISFTFSEDLLEDDSEVPRWFLSEEAQERIHFVLEILCENEVELNIRFCKEDEMAQTNGHFRGKQKPTDVLSFPPPPTPMMMGSEDEDEKQPLGDILICLPICQKQAAEYNHTLSQEVERMVVHGIVHLKGLDHERSESALKVQEGLELLLHKELQSHFDSPQWVKI